MNNTCNVIATNDDEETDSERRKVIVERHNFYELSYRIDCGNNLFATQCVFKKEN